MEQLDYDLIIEVVREELVNRGVPGSNTDDLKKTSFYQSGSKFLGLASSSKGKCNEFNCDSPKREKNPGFDVSKTPKSKNVSKSPFSSKHKFERKSGRLKKRVMECNEESLLASGYQVFGCELDNMDLIDTVLYDELPVSVPKFVYDACNIIKENAFIEGLFRKAGSAQRQQNVKYMLSKGYILPTTLHAIDAACLLKQFLRQLPMPLLPSHVHYFMIKCLDLANDEQLDALSLCTLLLPKRIQHLLAFVLESLSFVAAASQINKMHAHNLAIVLAPNLIPPSRVSAKNTLSDDKLLSSTIDVIERLIEGSHLACRMPSYIIAAAQQKEKCRSMENLCDAPSEKCRSIENLFNAPSLKKKRKSTSIQKFMSGFRRVCQAGSSVSQTPIPSSPLKTVSTPPISQDEPPDISMDPDIEMKPTEKPVKRKSEGFDSLQLRDDKSFIVPALESSRPKKKAKMEFKSARAESMPIMFSEEQLKPKSSDVNMKVSTIEKTPENLKRRYSFRDKMDILFSDPKSSEKRKFLKAKGGSDKKLPSRVQSCYSLNARSEEKFSLTPVKPAKRVKSFNFPRTNAKLCRTPREATESYGIEDFGISNLRSQWIVREVSKNSDIRFGQTASPSSIRSGLEKSSSAANFKPRRSPGIASYGTEETSTIASITKGTSPRVVSFEMGRGPSGSSLGIKRSSSIASLKTIKKSDEARLLTRSLGNASFESVKSPGGTSLGPRGCPDGAESWTEDSWVVRKISDAGSNVSNTQLVSDKYEQIKKDTQVLVSSPDEVLCRRLDKELRIRQRRSDEHRVIRSPSERKIGSIRRRSKELEQILSKQKSPVDVRSATPKLKGALLRSPQSSSLRRGKPNSVKSGLPILVKCTETPDNLNKTPPPKIVKVVKRNTISPRSANAVAASGRESEQKVLMSSGEYASDTMNSTYEGSVTRKRSLLAQDFIHPLYKPTMDNLCDESSGCVSGIGKRVSKGSIRSSTPNTSMISRVSGMDEDESSIDWVSASRYINDLSQEDLDRLMPVEMRGNRPSINALKEKKKVTANVQLFSQLQDRYGAPTPTRRGSRIKPSYQHPSLRNVKSDGCTPKLRTIDKSPLIRLDHQIPRSKLHGSGVVRGTPLAVHHTPKVVSPLKERNLPTDLVTPKIMSRERRSSKVKRLDSINLPPGIATPLLPRPLKPPHLITPKVGSNSFDTPRVGSNFSETPPRIPPRSHLSSAKKRSPNMKNYR